MMKIRSILTGIAISLSLAGMAQSQYDGAPVNRSANETSTDNVEVRRNKYPRSDNDWENFDVLHIADDSIYAMVTRAWRQGMAHSKINAGAKFSWRKRINQLNRSWIKEPSFLLFSFLHFPILFLSSALSSAKKN